MIFSWSELESLIDESGGPDRELLAIVIQKLAKKARAGIFSSGAPYQWIEPVVSRIRARVNEGKFYVLMDCLAILCDDGELNADIINEFLEDYNIGYRAHLSGWSSEIIWEKVEDIAEVEESKTEDTDGGYVDGVVLPHLDVDDVSKIEKSVIGGETKMKSHDERAEIFISHRSIDADVADMIKDYLIATGIPNGAVFCSSLPGNDVNERIGLEVKTHLKKSTINILILSRDYYESVYCLNEAGVAWYLDDVLTIPFGLPEISPENMIGFLNSEYKLRRLDCDEDIAYLLEMAQERIGKIGDAKPQIIVRENRKLKDKYLKHLGIRSDKNMINERVRDNDDFNFGDLDDDTSDNLVVEIIKNAGRDVSIKEIVEISGKSETFVRSNLQAALRDGKIEAVNGGRRRMYRVSN